MRGVGDKFRSTVRREFVRDAKGCETFPKALNETKGSGRCLLNYRPVGIAIYDDQVVVAAVVKVVCADALEGVRNWCSGYGGARG